MIYFNLRQKYLAVKYKFLDTSYQMAAETASSAAKCTLVQKTLSQKRHLIVNIHSKDTAPS